MAPLAPWPHGPMAPHHGSWPGPMGPVAPCPMPLSSRAPIPWPWAQGSMAPCRPSAHPAIAHSPMLPWPHALWPHASLFYKLTLKAPPPFPPFPLIPARGAMALWSHGSMPPGPLNFSTFFVSEVPRLEQVGGVVSLSFPFFFVLQRECAGRRMRRRTKV